MNNPVTQRSGCALRCRLALASILTCVAALPAAAQCDPGWLPGVGPSGVEGLVYCSARFDPDGAGPEPSLLVVGGEFSVRIDDVVVSNLAAWNGSRWISLGGVGADGAVNALTVFDQDGAGPASPQLVAGGAFLAIAGTPLARIGAWNGVTWSGLGSGVNSFVFALSSFDPDGTGPTNPLLIAGGIFSLAGGNLANRIAAWNGSTWSALGAGLNGDVLALAEFDEDGAGPGAPALFAGGQFLASGTEFLQRIGRWNGATWTAVAGGVNDTVRALAVFDPPGAPGPGLYAGGAFTMAGTTSALRVVRWDGAWTGQGAGFNADVYALASFDRDGAGAAEEELFAAGAFTNSGATPVSRAARFTGGGWVALGSGLNNTARTLALHDPDGPGSAPERLIACGDFTAAGANAALHVGGWDGVAWSRLGGFAAPVNALATFRTSASGPERLAAAGAFTSVDGVSASRIAEWDGMAWTNLGLGADGEVFAATEFDRDGAGPLAPVLVAGGSFGSAGGSPANAIAAWNGLGWSTLDSGLTTGAAPGVVRALAAFDLDGAGPNQPLLAAGGAFSEAGGTPAPNIAAWNGASWFRLGTAAISGTVRAAIEFDADGPGPELPRLIIGGDFVFTTAPFASSIAQWDGASWSTLGTGVSGGRVDAMTVFDFDGAGPDPARLVVGGAFVSAGGSGANRIAVWNGAAWSTLAPGFGDGSVLALGATPDIDGAGPLVATLHAGGTFTKLGDETPAASIVRWTGSGWADMGGTDGAVLALRAFDPDAAGPVPPQLMVAGSFVRAGGLDAASFARWGCVALPPVCCVDFNNDNELDFTDIEGFLGALVAMTPGDCAPGADFNNDGEFDFTDIERFLVLYNAGC